MGPVPGLRRGRLWSRVHATHARGDGMTKWGGLQSAPNVGWTRQTRLGEPACHGSLKDDIFIMLKAGGRRMAMDFAAPRTQADRRERPLLAVHPASLSAQIVADVREALFAQRLKPGDFLGTEKEIAARFGVSRIVARDALRTLQALGIADIRMGRGGGARVAKGNPRLFAEALAVQLQLTGVGAGEVLDAQRAVESLAAELAAENATPADHSRLRQLLAEGAAKIGDVAEYTRSCRDFHLAVAEASHN